jgi:HK97 family phage prohead protease
VIRYDTSPIGDAPNWVTNVGGLPAFIRAIAHALIRSGHSESQAIQLAVGVVKNWASGQGHVSAKTRAKAAAAVAEWEAKKAASHASRGAMMADSKKMPYGDVEYADPGYQKDGKKRYPLDSEEHCRAAWSYINQGDNAAQYTPDQLARVKAKIKAAAKKYGIEISDAQRDESLFEATQLYAPPPGVFMRSFPLEDIHITRSADGRTVEAYAAVFDTAAEIRDHEGHYNEVIDPRAFDQAISRARTGEAWRVGVFYNHAMTMHGTPSDRGSVPIGTPVDIRPDGRGLLTVTRYNATPLAEEVLEAIKAGSITGQSFTGKIMRSDPALSRAQRRRGGYQVGMDGQLQTVRRTELGLQEYGPTPMPAYQGAAIMGVRAFPIGTHPDEDQAAEPDESVPAAAAPADGNHFHRRIQAAMRARGIQ